MLSEKKRAYDKVYQRDNTVLITLRLHKIGDADLIRLLTSPPQGYTRSGYLKHLLRSKIGGPNE